MSASDIGGSNLDTNAQGSSPGASSNHLLETFEISSNLRHPIASNIAVSSCRIFVAVGIFAFSFLSSAAGDPYANVPSPVARFVPAQLSGHTPQRIAMNPARTFDLYGPQATERAVRSSLKVALLPDPVAMGALIFCAFALRTMRVRRVQSPAERTANRVEVLPRAA